MHKYDHKTKNPMLWRTSGKYSRNIDIECLIMVGATGFEPAAT